MQSKLAEKPKPHEPLRQWRFIPVRRGAEAVAAHVVVPGAPMLVERFSQA